MMDGGLGFGFGHGGGFIGIFFWIILIVAIIVAVRWLMDNKSSTAGQSDKALDILKQRYARGEIDLQEYEQKRREISGNSD
ncbi:SHOCT domain-containing protein [Thiohalophilus thiocyanatoxydans]|uniref:Putative membrane protein n=1 Tax=Thiohalophilus thiocyanatoxydans TaxID=381308 RepID=A0A4R8INI9_9GAMM|nr:SHOCT domain-containing protein [Thiohalophilus thiocyanatoxydans]TDY02442.1 putative membrane protein [Thiohalophilus thiocyanatoxydans]